MTASSIASGRRGARRSKSSDGGKGAGVRGGGAGGGGAGGAGGGGAEDGEGPGTVRQNARPRILLITSNTDRSSQQKVELTELQLGSRHTHAHCVPRVRPEHTQGMPRASPGHAQGTHRACPGQAQGMINAIGRAKSQVCWFQAFNDEFIKSLYM